MGTLLCAASEAGELEVVRFLVKECDALDVKTEYKVTCWVPSSLV